MRKLDPLDVIIFAFVVIIAAAVIAVSCTKENKKHTEKPGKVYRVTLIRDGKAVDSRMVR